jgi:hypothetical protein
MKKTDYSYFSGWFTTKATSFLLSERIKRWMGASHAKAYSAIQFSSANQAVLRKFKYGSRDCRPAGGFEKQAGRNGSDQWV